MKKKFSRLIILLFVMLFCASCMKNLPGTAETAVQTVVPAGDEQNDATPAEMQTVSEPITEIVGTPEWVLSGTAREIPAGTTFTSPWDYCRAVGTIDSPGAEFTGENPHPEIRKQVLLGIARLETEGAKDTIIWRCMDDKVYGCDASYYQDCLTIMDLSSAPNEAAISECAKAEMNGVTLPSAVVGRETPYEWICVDGKPAISGQGISVDEQGYNALIWFSITKP